MLTQGGPARDLAAGLSTAIQGRWREDQDKVCPCFDITDNDLFKVSTGNACVIHEHIILLACQILIYCERLIAVLATVADKDRLLDVCHKFIPSARFITYYRASIYLISNNIQALTTGVLIRHRSQ